MHPNSFTGKNFLCWLLLLLLRRGCGDPAARQGLVGWLLLLRLLLQLVLLPFLQSLSRQCWSH